MLTGDTTWFGASIPTNVFSAPVNWYIYHHDYFDWSQGITDIKLWADSVMQRQSFVWTNYVTKPTATYRTTTNYTWTAIVTNVTSGVTNILTNTFYSSTNYVNTREMNTFADYNWHLSYVPYRPEGSYEVSSMFFPFERDTALINRIDSTWEGESYMPEGADPIHPGYWSTNAFNDMARALSLLQWAKEYRTASRYADITVVWSNAHVSAMFVSDGISTNSGIVNPAMWGAYRGNRPEYQYTLTLSARVTEFAITNTRPFAIDNVIYDLYTVSTNADIPSEWITRPSTISAVAAGSSATTAWYPMSPEEMKDWMNDFASGWLNGDSIPAMDVSVPYAIFHVQFQSLTNYLTHAPAR
jgi:hypothetical protein